MFWNVMIWPDVSFSPDRKRLRPDPPSCRSADPELRDRQLGSIEIRPGALKWRKIGWWASQLIKRWRQFHKISFELLQDLTFTSDFTSRNVPIKFNCLFRKNCFKQYLKLITYKNIPITVIRAVLYWTTKSYYYFICSREK